MDLQGKYCLNVKIKLVLKLLFSTLKDYLPFLVFSVYLKYKLEETFALGNCLISYFIHPKTRT